MERREYNFTEKKDTRSGFGDGLYEVGSKNKDIIALCADLTGSLKMGKFKEAISIRYKFKYYIWNRMVKGLISI